MIHGFIFTIFQMDRNRVQDQQEQKKKKNIAIPTPNNRQFQKTLQNFLNIKRACKDTQHPRLYTITFNYYFSKEAKAKA